MILPWRTVLPNTDAIVLGLRISTVCRKTMPQCEDLEFRIRLKCFYVELSTEARRRESQ